MPSKGCSLRFAQARLSRDRVVAAPDSRAIIPYTCAGTGGGPLPASYATPPVSAQPASVERRKETEMASRGSALALPARRHEPTEHPRPQHLGTPH